MSGWTCPACEHDFDDGDYPDHWSEGAQRFNFECECGVSFDVDVDWSPNFYVLKSTLVRVRGEKP